VSDSEIGKVRDGASAEFIELEKVVDGFKYDPFAIAEALMRARGEVSALWVSVYILSFTVVGLVSQLIIHAVRG
jgi:hypothetical protein